MKRIFWTKVLFYFWAGLTIYCIVTRSWWGYLFFFNMVLTHINVILLIRLEKIKHFEHLLKEISDELDEKMKQRNGNEKR